MRRFLMCAAIAVAMLLTVTACTAPKAIELTQADSGSSQTLAAGQELVVTLDSNPTTGYRWELDGPPLEELAAEEPEYTAQSSAIGGGGTEVWRFRADSKGAGELRLKYWRSFEPTVAPIKTFTVKIKVN